MSKNANKWPNDDNPPRNQCKADGCRKQPEANTPFCREHNQKRWAVRRAELEAEQAQSEARS
jgi:hypothetical protein